jgi:hypothetical protein
MRDIISLMSSVQAPQPSVPDNPTLPADRKTQARIRRFMEAYAKTGDVRAAARSARFSLATHYRMLETSESYRQAFAMAQEQVADALEAEAFRRAINGSDELLAFLLRACDLCREHLIQEHSGTITLSDLEASSVREVLARVISIRGERVQ